MFDHLFFEGGVTHVLMIVLVPSSTLGTSGAPRLARLTMYKYYVLLLMPYHKYGICLVQTFNSQCFKTL